MPSVEELLFRNARGRQLAGSLHRPARPSGAGVVVCHGMLSSRESAKHRGICEALARRGLVALRFDFTGRGDSEGTTEQIAYDSQVEDLDAAVALLGQEVDRLGVVGSSMGGATALLFASRSPARVSAVVGIAAVGRPGAVLGRLQGDGDAEAVKELEARWEATGVAELQGFRLGWCLVRSGRQADVLGAAAQLHCPLLLVHGVLDDVVPVSQARELAEAAPQARLIEVSDGDHLLHRPEDQALLEREVGAFMSEWLVEMSPG